MFTPCLTVGFFFDIIEVYSSLAMWEAIMTTLHDIFSAELPWYRKVFPFLPFAYNDKRKRFIQIQLFECSHKAVQCSRVSYVYFLKAHFAHRWYQPRWIGIKIWY
jgi:hypothetical protein